MAQLRSDTVIAKTDGSGVRNLNTYLDKVDAATSAATPNTIVQRDVNGNISVGNASSGAHALNRQTADGRYARTSGAKVFISGSFAGFRGDADTGTNFEVDALIDGIRRGLLSISNSQVELRKYANDGTTIEKRLTLTSSNATIDGNAIHHAGNLPYETGNWTPDLRFGGSNAGITYALRAGRYTRIANVVYWSFTISLSSKGSASGDATISGLPFNSGPITDFFHTVGRASNISVPSGQWLSSYNPGTAIVLATSAGSRLTNAEFANNSILQASGFYFIS